MTATEYLDPQGLADKIYETIEAHKGTYQLKSTVPYMQLIAQYFERVARAKKEGKLLVSRAEMLPVEIFYAMDIMPFAGEFYFVYMSLFQDLQPFMDAAAEHGLPAEICSYHRMVTGAMDLGAWPRVNAYVNTNVVCDNTAKHGEIMARFEKVPSYFLERPYTLTSPQSLTYWREQMEGLVKFLEAQVGRKMDPERFQEAVRLAYRTTEVCQEINELRKTVPSPMPAEGAFIPMAIERLLAGLPEALECLEQLRDELKDRVEKGIGAVPEERFRIIYPFCGPGWDMELMALMEQRYGAVLVQEFMQSWRGKGEWWVDPADPVGSLARKSSVFPCTFHTHGPMAEWVDDIVKMAREYRADGAIFFAHIGCHEGCQSIRSIKDELESQLGVPMAVISCDLVDKSFTSRNEVFNKLDSYFEMLEDSKNYQMRRQAMRKAA